MHTDQDFTKEVIKRAIERGATNFGQLLHRSGGMYPAELAALQKSEDIQPAQPLTTYDRSITTTSRQLCLPLIDEQRLSLPAPHPLDHDWRFTEATLTYLTDVIVEITSPGDHILILGAPSVLIGILAKATACTITLVDRNSALVNHISAHGLPERISVLQRNLFHATALNDVRKAQVIVCDPPWYVEHYTAFIAHAAQAATIGATVLVSLLPMSSKSLALRDRWEILTHAQELGLHVQSIEAGALRYQTPEFEAASLLAADITLEGDWRSADLLTLRKVHETDPPIVTRHVQRARRILDAAESVDWEEFVLDGRKIMLRKPIDNPDTTPALIPIEPGDVLRTVSRSYPKRAHVDLWLWDNRVFGVRGKAAFWAALHALAGCERPSWLPQVSRHNVQRASHLLRKRLNIS